MYFPASNRALTRTLMAGALVFAGTTACSRSDRSASGSDTNAAVLQDTLTPGMGQGSATGAATNDMADTQAVMGADTMSGTGTAIGDTAPARIQSDAPRAATAAPASEDTLAPGDTASAGYRAMEQDTAPIPHVSDSARVTEDTSEISQGISDTEGQISDTVSAEIAAADTAFAADTVAGYVEMARDTTGVADQIDTATAAVADTAGAVQARVDTAQAETELAVADSAEAVGVQVADTIDNDGRIRPPEDSTEILGTADAADTADEAPVNANVQDTEIDDSERVAASEVRTDEVGAAAIGGTVTGAEAVALLTRQGIQCIVVDPETDEEVRWDMSRTPAPLNPCGLGSMNLSKIWTER